MGIKKLFFQTAVVNTATAATNLLGTVLLVRWFGSEVYADYMVVLAYLGLVSILLEVVPSNYSVFAVQDDPEMLNSLAGLAVLTSVVLVVSYFLLWNLLNIFRENSLWVIPYVFTIAIKRYLDIRLQSSGRLREFLIIELRSAVIRIIMMGGLLLLAVPATDAVWCSLAIGVIASQFIWFFRNPHERAFFRNARNFSVWSKLLSERKNYPPYYLGIALKRLRDNALPILANEYFINREALGAFFLTYRGLAFSLGQIRIVEGFLNHRVTLNKVFEMPLLQKFLVALIGQVICIVASLGLLISSGVYTFDFVSIVTLSFIVWIYTESIFERSKAYSSYNTTPVNAALFNYCLTIFGLTYFFIFSEVVSQIYYCLILVVSDLVFLFTLKCFNRLRGV